MPTWPKLENPSIGADFVAQRSMSGAQPQSNRCSALTASTRPPLRFSTSRAGVVFETSIILHLRNAGADDLIFDSQPASGVSACSKS